MNRAKALKLKVGDEVQINPLWNKTEPERDKILSPTRVVDLHRHSVCETAVMVKVKTRSGEIWLDAGWFK